MIVPLVLLSLLSLPNHGHCLEREEYHVNNDSPSTRRLAYGIDCSFPIRDDEINCREEVVESSCCLGVGDRRKLYRNYMQGCRDHYGDDGYLCDDTENTERFRRNRLQPQSMVNYTSTGFLKMRAPEELMKLLVDSWNENKDDMASEEWRVGDTFTNHWESPTYLVDLARDESSMEFATAKVYSAARSILEDWTGVELSPAAQYGIRVYTRGAMLAPHVDRLPLVIACIINVVQEDVQEDWPLEVYDRNGVAVNVTLRPGDMLLYESASTIHGRPFPFRGRQYANMFVHFEPTGRAAAAAATERGNHRDPAARSVPLVNHDNVLPPYLLPNSPWVEEWMEENPEGWSITVER